jgi:cyclophilin family peptidyl-prolyl cis-trans isomerase
MKKTTLTISLAILLILIAGCVQTPEYIEKGTIVNTQETPEPNIEDVSAEPEQEEDTMAKKTTIVMETSKGTIELALNGRDAPVTVENFLRYVAEGHYDGTVFHRVIDGFMIQGGGFTTDGKQKGTHSPIKLESQNGLLNKRGSIAMARTNVPDSATNQFFINVADNRMLDYAPGNDGYAVFGKVVSGMEVVDAIKAVETTTKNSMDDWPVEDVLIEKVYVKG